jgi:hypothetical protein
MEKLVSGAKYLAGADLGLVSEIGVIRGHTQTGANHPASKTEITNG